MTELTGLMLLAALIVLGGTVWMSYRGISENLLSLAIGTILTLYFGINELLQAVAAPGSAEFAPRVATSVAFTVSGALLTRLVVRQLRESSGRVHAKG